MSRVPYFSDVGSLMYVVVCLHPNFGLCSQCSSKYMAKPGKEHWKAV